MGLFTVKNENLASKAYRKLEVHLQFAVNLCLRPLPDACYSSKNHFQARLTLQNSIFYRMQEPMGLLTVENENLAPPVTCKATATWPCQ